MTHVRALGTIIKWDGEPFTENEFYCGVLDYFDWWHEVDPRLAPHQDQLSPPAFAVGHDIVNMATYVGHILRWLEPERIKTAPSVIVVGGMTEAFLFSARSACDAIAVVLAYCACEKPGQAGNKSLHDLIKWAHKNKHKVRPEVFEILSGDFKWFYRLKHLRDQISHGLADANIYRNARQFFLWMRYKKAVEDREPLLPLLADQLRQITALADRTARVTNKIIKLPPDRIKSRVVHGLYISELHRLISIAPDYAGPPP